MKNPPATQGATAIDLIGDSLSHPLAVAFSKSGSPNYGAAVELAKSASKYAEKAVGRTVMHMAAFSSDRLQMSRALALLRYIKGLKSTQLYAGGKLLISAHRTEEVINCFLTAAACNDWRAHCHRTIRNPFATTEERTRWIEGDLAMPGFGRINGRLAVIEPKSQPAQGYRFPCKFMTRYGEIHFRLDPGHAASATDQIQAMAVAQDCAWCPNFKPEDFKKL